MRLIEPVFPRVRRRVVLRDNHGYIVLSASCSLWKGADQQSSTELSYQNDYLRITAVQVRTLRKTRVCC